jgi:hypothetical protein
MPDQILKFTICNTPLGALDHYEISFQIDPAAFPCGFTVLPSEMVHPSDLNEAKTVAMAKASAQKAQEMLVRTDDPSFIGPVTL